MMNNNPRILFALSLGLAVLPTGCSNPADGVAQATVSPSTNTVTSAPTTGGKRYALRPDNSKIEFTGSKVTGKHDGGFRAFAGELTVVEGRVADTGNRILIDMDSTWADNPDVTQHLKRGDFFEAPKFPTAEFVSTSVQSGANGWTIAGNLQLHGITKAISFPAKIEVSDAGVTVASEFVIKRFDWDVKYRGMANDLVRDEVVLRLDVKAVPGAADFTAIEKLVKK